MSAMRCHYCRADAAYAAESNGLRVGLCDDHLQIFVQTCVEEDLSTALDALAEG